jgi:hypothetical protein
MKSNNDRKMGSEKYFTSVTLSAATNLDFSAAMLPQKTGIAQRREALLSRPKLDG